MAQRDLAAHCIQCRSQTGQYWDQTANKPQQSSIPMHDQLSTKRQPVICNKSTKQNCLSSLSIVYTAGAAWVTEYFHQLAQAGCQQLTARACIMYRCTG